METVVESDEHQTAVQGSTERHLVGYVLAI